MIKMGYDQYPIFITLSGFRVNDNDLGRLLGSRHGTNRFPGNITGTAESVTSHGNIESIGSGKAERV